MLGKLELVTFSEKQALIRYVFVKRALKCTNLKCIAGKAESAKIGHTTRLSHCKEVQERHLHNRSQTRLGCSN